MNVLITDALDAVCSELLDAIGVTPFVHLKKSPEKLEALTPEAAGWIVRSGTTITADLIAAAPKLGTIGRAGVGVDNIDFEATTRRGILVLNAPDGNTVSTAEHTCTMTPSTRLGPSSTSPTGSGRSSGIPPTGRCAASRSAATARRRGAKPPSTSSTRPRSPARWSSARGEMTLTAIGVDGPVPADVVQRIRAIEGVRDVCVVNV